MKRILLIMFFLPVSWAQAQIISYADGAVLFSGEDNYGTARFMGMSGAFGALGGDMSAVDINPAGLGVFNATSFSGTLSFNNMKNSSSFYGEGIGNKDDNFNFSQIGAATVFYTNNTNGFQKIVLGFNYGLVRDFDNSFFVTGNSNAPDFLDDPFLNFDDNPFNDIYYVNVDQQNFKNYTYGSNNRFSFSIASQYNDNLYLGMSFNSHQLDFYQRAEFSEFNNDGSGNTLDAYLDQYLDVYGFGFNFSLGAIFKPMESVRLGVAYKSPTWYDLSERFTEDLEIYPSNTTDVYSEYGSPNYFDYSMNTPSEFTGSAAYIFSKFGLISFDYIYRDYQNTYLKPSGDFIEDNGYIDQNLKGTSSFRLGTEWIVSNLSFRGGYRFVQSPYQNSFVNEDYSGYSLGMGIKFGRSLVLDFAYDSYSRSYAYRFLNIEGVDPAVIDEDIYRITSSMVFTF
ncbi:MAG: hypothetical protein WBN28_07865 [Lutimonas sp.]